jgi:lipoprotein
MECSNYRNDFVIVSKFILVGIVWNILISCCVKYIKDKKSMIEIIFDMTRESLTVSAEPFAIYNMVGV